ncbi:unnamed protein product [Moneuplotes crassus]|uniref:Uncharacterized protein n=1 Tax=Euplotes crassus TaxID=5936 RepID=A0AAD1XUI1_EUPCR|nr:unnamed protein product [Moneuplotes crassus]
MDKNSSLISEAQKKLASSGNNYADVIIADEGDGLTTVRIVAPGKSSGTSGIPPFKTCSGYTYYKIKSDIITLKYTTETYTNGNTYDGEIKVSTGKRHGTGTYKCKSGSKYVGQFVDGNMEGKGTCYYASGDQYEGDFMNGKRHGQGVYTWKHGETYTGRWANHSRNGHGVNTYKNGDRYEGNFENGKRNGYGIMYYKSGGKWEGQWKDDEQVEQYNKEKKVEYEVKKKESSCIIF